MHRPPSADQALKGNVYSGMRYTLPSRLVHAAVAVGAAPGCKHGTLMRLSACTAKSPHAHATLQAWCMGTFCQA
ncbi:hypothetical protein [Paenibacillus sp. DCT19]|uniref:hypothetical protein n=1 Tax=Paenibacillus sp. DCT19 TaxID=2211212 RepID=UPI000FE261CE|nr:hypothetical protein [Paenibacillus sp. DCT19]